MADKHIITVRIQPPIFQIVNDGISNYREQRQCIDLLRFLLCIGDQFLVPVQILNFNAQMSPALMPSRIASRSIA